MAKYKGDPANTNYDAGDFFNYEVWDAESELTLCNVPWDAVYKDVVHFDSTNDLNKYIDENGDITKLRNASYARISEPIQIDTPFGRASQFNYIRVFNAAQPIAGDSPKYYYYFIRDIRHVAGNNTEIIVQLDVWQTYIRQVQFGRAYIERGHIGIANKHNFRNYGRDYLTISEGLDIGAEYVTVVSKSIPIMDGFQNSTEPTFNVMAISTIDLNGDHGTESAPKNPSARPTFIQSGIPSGAGVYVWDSAKDFMSFLADYSKKPWVTAGLVSITLLPDQSRWAQYGFGYSSEKDPNTKARAGYIAPQIRRDLFRDWRNADVVHEYIPERYRHLRKLFTSPYCMLELTFNSGSAIVLKPESWNSRDASIVEMLSIMPPNQRYAAVPLNYNGRSSTKNDGQYYEWNKDGDYLDMALFLSNFPTIPIVNNGQIMYLASNARSIAAQYSSNDWAQQRALTGNQVSYDNATTGINAGTDMANNAIAGDTAGTAAQNEFAAQQALLGMLQNTGMGGALGLAGGPIGGMLGAAAGAASGAMGMWNQGMQADQANRMLANRSNTATNASNIQGNAGRAVRDANKGLADWAAKGDYANNRLQMDAKIQDAAMLPHGMSGQFGGETFNLVNDEMNLTLRVKMPDQASIAITGEFWLRYGYPVRRSARIPNDLRVMNKFSYWKLSECYIQTAGMPETFKQTIRGILEKGVTVWNDPSELGIIDFADNSPLPDIIIDGYEPPDWEPEVPPEPPEPIKRKKKKMITFATNDGGMKYALAGSSPGTPANWIDTESEAEKDEMLESCGVETPFLIASSRFYELRDKFLAPVSTFEFVEGP